MKIVLAMVTSVNGYSTRDHDHPDAWASKEDQEYFLKNLKKFPVIVMGKNTYLAAKKNIIPTQSNLRIVLVSNISSFKNNTVTDALEFSDEDPLTLVKRLKNDGYKSMLLLGGASINSSFLKEKLIDELWLTLEPLIFTKGKGLVNNLNKNVNLKLKDYKLLNPKGTLLLKYSFEYDK